MCGEKLFFVGREGGSSDLGECLTAPASAASRSTDSQRGSQPAGLAATAITFQCDAHDRPDRPDRPELEPDFREPEPEPVPRMALALPFSSAEATCRWRPLGTRSSPFRRLLAQLPRFAVPAAQ